MEIPLTHGRLETLQHTVYGGDTHQIPLFIDREQGLTEESNALLHALDIIGGNLDQFDDDIHSVPEMLGAMLASHEQHGFVLEDKTSTAALSVNLADTIVSKVGVGTWSVSTPMFFETIAEWTRLAAEQK